MLISLGLNDENEILVAFDDGMQTLISSRLVLTSYRGFRCYWVNSYRKIDWICAH